MWSNVSSGLNLFDHRAKMTPHRADFHLSGVESIAELHSHLAHSKFHVFVRTALVKTLYLTAEVCFKFRDVFSLVPPMPRP